MKELEIPAGGMPLHAGDLNWMTAGFKEALKAHLFGTNCVLQGCHLSKNGTDFEIAEGFVFVDGEIYYVPAHTVVDNDGSGNKSYDATNWSFNHGTLSGQNWLKSFVFEEQTNYNSDGSDEFHDGNVRDTYKRKTMEGRFGVQQGLPQTNDPEYLNIAGRTYEEVLLHHIWDRLKFPEASAYENGYSKDSLREYSYKYVSSYPPSGAQDEIVEFQAATPFDLTPFLNNDWQASSQFGPPRLIKDISGRVFIAGGFDGTSATSNIIVNGSDVPSKFHPSYGLRLDAVYNSGSGDEDIFLAISTIGDIAVIDPNQTYGDLIAEGLNYLP